ncbi:MAG TPA: PrsW family intramembrane metalloprotease [Candidatus Thermoplasmatota archaeon]|nr:PrsW family intramembrane metalloprotease [Candidatus Thermoplasmatota archaeon]
MALAGLRRVGVVALGETARTGGSFNRKTTTALLLMMVVTGVVTPVLMDRGLDFDRGLYRAAATPDALLLPAAQSSRLFAVSVVDDPVAAVRRGDADIAILRSFVDAPETQKGDAAMAALRQAAKDYAYGRLAAEEDLEAAFPVRVELRYLPQEGARAAATGGGIPTELARPPDEPEPGGDGGGSTRTVSGGGGAPGASVPAQASGSGFDFLPAERSVNTPETLAPPFPFRSLLLAYVFLIPMNFVVQVYAGSAISERLGRKGEALLASPARPWEIIVGKALPYFALMMLVGAGIVLWIGAGWLSLVAIAPLAYTFLALEFAAAMFARSFRELTFLTVFTSVLLTIYAFLPAVFSDIHPISLVSPITLVVFDLRGEAATLGQILYATMPLTLFSTVLFMLGAALYREEDLFHQKPVVAKAIDSVARQVRGLRSALSLPALFLPFVFVAELLLVTFLFAWPVEVGLLGILLAVAFVEETFKAAPSYAGVRRGMVPAKRAVLFGALVGVGFFLAEKLFLLASLAGLYEVPAGAAVFGAAGGTAASGAAWLLVAALLLGPLVLHTVTAGISAWGARRDGRTFAAAFCLAIAIHTAYNFAVVKLLGGGLP